MKRRSTCIRTALIHPVDTRWQAPIEARFVQAGIIVCARVPRRVERGDCLFHLATEPAR